MPFRCNILPFLRSIKFWVPTIKEYLWLKLFLKWFIYFYQINSQLFAKIQYGERLLNFFFQKSINTNNPTLNSVLFNWIFASEWAAWVCTEGWLILIYYYTISLAFRRSLAWISSIVIIVYTLVYLSHAILLPFTSVILAFSFFWKNSKIKWYP